MPLIRPQFGGLNTDYCPSRLPSGSADVALNVIVEDGVLKKRPGFASVATMTATSSASDMFIAELTGGTAKVYISAGYIYTTPTGSALVDGAGGAISGITGGWWFVWKDQIYYASDKAVYIVSGSNAGKKAGLPKPKFAPTSSASGAGEKGLGTVAGYYHVYLGYKNSTTGEESVVTDTPTAVQCTIGAGTGAVSITNWTTQINAAAGTNTDAAYYSWDKAVFYSSLGTDVVRNGVTERQVYSYIGYEDTIAAAAHDASGTVTLSKADQMLRRERTITNAGGEPPASLCGCFTGRRAIYFTSTAMYYSIPEFPTMVPQEQTYGSAGTAFLFRPIPYTGVLNNGIEGTPVAAAAGAGLAVVCTVNNIYEVREDSSGRMFPVLVKGGVGCIAARAIIGTVHGVFGLGRSGVFWQYGRDGYQDLSTSVIATELDTLTTAKMAYFSAHEQVWIMSGRTIYVWDIPERKFYKWTLAYPASGSIVAARENKSASADPSMYVLLSKGEILSYPTEGADGTGADTDADYACQWRGYFGQENLHASQRLIQPTLLTGSNCAELVTVGLRVMKTPKETAEQTTHVLTLDNDLEVLSPQLDTANGRLFQLDITSAAEASAGDYTRWAIHDFFMATET